MYGFVLFMTALVSCFCKLEALRDGWKSEGVFWHITDIHLDTNYSRTGDPSQMCHISSEHTLEDNGKYGNFLCDSPEELINLTFSNMKNIEGKPDFIMWTGDNLPHTRPSPGWDETLQTLYNVTMQLKTAFPTIPIYPSIGNHDTVPPNNITPENGSSLYEDYLEKGGWKHILPKETLSDFRAGGYYSHSPKPGLRVISLNTILWYESNKEVQNKTNPFQMDFLNETLQQALCHKEKVYIIGHVAPGFYNRFSEEYLNIPMYYPQYLKEYLKIVRNFSSVIAGQFFGHVHNDYFQLYFCDTGVPQSSGLLAGSVTPWYSDYGGMVNISLPVNPGVRLMYYSRSDFLLLDYEQYFLNLTDANLHPEKEPSYALLYTFTKAYGVADLSTKSLLTVFERLKVNQTLYNQFFNFLTTGKKSVPCDEACKTAQLCAIAATSAMEHFSCMHPTVKGAVYPETRAHTVEYVVGFMFAFVSIALITVVVVYRKTRWPFKRSFRYTAFYNLLTS